MSVETELCLLEEAGGKLTIIPLSFLKSPLFLKLFLAIKRENDKSTIRSHWTFESSYLWDYSIEVKELTAIILDVKLRFSQPRFVGRDMMAWFAISWGSPIFFSYRTLKCWEHGSFIKKTPQKPFPFTKWLMQRAWSIIYHQFIRLTPASSQDATNCTSLHMSFF